MKVRPVHTRWVKRDEPQPVPETKAQQKARHLPMPGPGIVVPVPLHLLPEYLELYQLVPNGIVEPKEPRRDGPGEALLLVKRIPKGTNG